MKAVSNFSPAAAELIEKLVRAVSDDDRSEANLLLLEIHNLNDESIPDFDRSNLNNITTALLESARIFTEEAGGQWRTHFGGMRGQTYVDIMTIFRGTSAITMRTVSRTERFLRRDMIFRGISYSKVKFDENS